MLSAPINSNGQGNDEVIQPYVNAADLAGKSRGMYVIDFGQRSLEDAAVYALPFQYVERHVKPLRENNKDKQRRTFWWRHGRSGSQLKQSLQNKKRQMATPLVSKHRFFVWLPADTVVSNTVFAIARDDDYFFGVLHSKAHELWALRMGTSLEDRPRYTPSTTFETFPFPWSPGTEPAEADSPHVQAIADAARALVAARDAWLNPEGATPPADLRTRTLTNLYNARPDWLASAHAALDAAVFAAYAHTTGEPWPPDMTDDELLARLLALNLKRANA